MSRSARDISFGIRLILCVQPTASCLPSRQHQCLLHSRTLSVLAPRHGKGRRARAVEGGAGAILRTISSLQPNLFRLSLSSSCYPSRTYVLKGSDVLNGESSSVSWQDSKKSMDFRSRQRTAARSSLPAIQATPVLLTAQLRMSIAQSPIQNSRWLSPLWLRPPIFLAQVNSPSSLCRIFKSWSNATLKTTYGNSSHCRAWTTPTQQRHLSKHRQHRQWICSLPDHSWSFRKPSPTT